MVNSSPRIGGKRTRESVTKNLRSIGFQYVTISFIRDPIFFYRYGLRWVYFHSSTRCCYYYYCYTYTGTALHAETYLRSGEEFCTSRRDDAWWSMIIIWTTNNNNKYYYICFMARKAYTYITYNIIHMCIMLADGWRRRNRNNMCTPHNMYIIIIILYTRYRLKTAAASTAYTRYLYYNVIT